MHAHMCARHTARPEYQHLSHFSALLLFAVPRLPSRAAKLSTTATVIETMPLASQLQGLECLYLGMVTAAAVRQLLINEALANTTTKRTTAAAAVAPTITASCLADGGLAEDISNVTVTITPWWSTKPKLITAPATAAKPRPLAALKAGARRASREFGEAFSGARQKIVAKMAARKANKRAKQANRLAKKANKAAAAAPTSATKGALAKTSKSLMAGAGALGRVLRRLTGERLAPMPTA
jgi:hypothetical protein